MVRLGEKEAQIALIAERLKQPPQTLPPVAEWVGFDTAVWDYRRTTLTGTFRNDQTILVFTSLNDPRGARSGPGYWVMAPLVLDGGGVVWVNRGFVPDTLKATFADGGPAPKSHVTLTGVLRRPEQPNAFTPGKQAVNRIDWIRDPARLAEMSLPTLTPVLPVYFDQDAGAPDALPQAGETRFELPNRHFEYAMTWFALALMTPAMLVNWIRIRRRG